MTAVGAAPLGSRVSLFSSATDNVGTGFTTVGEVIASVRGGTYRDQVSRVRQAFAAGDKDTVDTLKRSLPAVTFSGEFSRRRADGLKEPSGVLVVDIDHLGVEIAPQIRDMLAGSPFVLAAFVSPSGAGVKAAVRIDPTRPFKDSFRAAQALFAREFTLEVDPSRSDICGLCFVSDDPDAFVNEGAEIIPYDAPPLPRERVQSVPGGESPGDDYDARGDWRALLRKHGWKSFGSADRYWTRPGKDRGVSATWDASELTRSRFYPFTSNAAPLRPGHLYRPWHLFAELECGGDFREAARRLAREGFGSPRSQGAVPLGCEGVGPDDQVQIAGGPQPNTARADLLLARFDAGRLDYSSPPTRPESRITINGKSVCTAGNISNIIAQSKTGKSSFLGAIISSVIAADAGISDVDTLSVRSCQIPRGHILLHIDSEQNEYDHFVVIDRSVRRTGVTDTPAWLRSHRCTGWPARDIRDLIPLAMERAHRDGGIFALMIDGWADCVTDVNDPKESNAFVAEMQALAIKYACPIIGVIHDNEGSKTNGDGRGHLGKQLMRKAESNLRLRKDGEVTVVFSEKQRGAPILETEGPRFTWSSSLGMHVSCAALGAQRSAAKAEKLRTQAEEVFADLQKSAASWAEILKAIEHLNRVTKSTSEDRFTAMKKAGVLIKIPGTNLWRINNDPGTP